MSDFIIIVRQYPRPIEEYDNDVAERGTKSFVDDDFDPSVWDEINPYG